ncbi:hypothetical protein [Nitrospirillum viridazoti]|uniref:Uncharacterized protein n=1 Tax=Nitrospirillum viridazoti CBAmc TaxID=1441467 RepID=A0A248JRV1_9PROT|nr:hypothetical protein [Nitrospirillum amazonense]ASG21425.1 hypothetical protein Y958_11735 [Nitrospirillum amazonense CBAmc]TWB29340.1 hypothetical protein FBZ91_1267 [Nitrospirillum amazonense]
MSTLSDILGDIAPTISAILGTVGGPVGALAGKALEATSSAILGHPGGTEDDIKAAVSAGLSGDTIAALQRADADLKIQLSKAQVDLGQQRVQNASDVNKTMQTEAAAEHWPTYTWRPAIGLVFAGNLALISITVFAAYVAVMFGASKADILDKLPAMIGAMSALNGTALPILGVASWYRGVMQANPNIPTVNRG